MPFNNHIDRFFSLLKTSNFQLPTSSNCYSKLNILFTILFFILFISCNTQTENTHKLRIAAASNMQFALKELASRFTQETNIETELIIGSSGKLTAQIKEGAPFDVFLSADLKYPLELFEQGLTQGKPLIYAKGQLVLWSMNPKVRVSLDSLTQSSIKHIALANPKNAPYGLAAKDVLEQKRLWQVVENKLVFGESIAQTNQFIMTQSADIGFTAKSVVLSDMVKGKGKWVDVDPQLYRPIDQGFVVIKHPKLNPSQAEAFKVFLFSEKGQKVLGEFGYLIE